MDTVTATSRDGNNESTELFTRLIRVELPAVDKPSYILTNVAAGVMFKRLYGQGLQRHEIVKAAYSGVFGNVVTFRVTCTREFEGDEL
jgi:hypothetical protein